MATEKNITAEGTYLAKADDGVKWGESTNGNLQIGVSLAIMDEGPFKGRRLPWYSTFPDPDDLDAGGEKGRKAQDSERITLEGLTAMGLPHPSAIDFSSDRQKWLGTKNCIIVVRHKTLQTYENGELVDKLDEDGRVQIIAEIAFINSGGANFKTAASSDTRKKFGERFAKRFGSGNVITTPEGKPDF